MKPVFTTKFNSVWRYLKLSACRRSKDLSSWVSKTRKLWKFEGWNWSLTKVQKQLLVESRPKPPGAKIKPRWTRSDFFLFFWFFGAETLQSRKRLAKCPGFSGKAFKQIFIKLYKIMKHSHSNERKLESKTSIKNAR